MYLGLLVIWQHFAVLLGSCVGPNGINYLGVMTDNQLTGVGEQTCFLD